MTQGTQTGALEGWDGEGAGGWGWGGGSGAGDMGVPMADSC